jgi:glycosyltransferase involved in cell wall biosynthesis
LALVTSGRGGALPELLSLAAMSGVGDRLHIAPYVPPHHVPAYLGSADLGIVTSLHSPNYEASMPTKLTEYLHARLALVVSDLRTNAEFVRETGVGEVFEAGDPTDFARAVRTALGRRSELERAISDDLLDELSWERQADRLMDVYSSITGIAPRQAEGAIPWEAVETSDPPRARRSGRGVVE